MPLEADLVIYKFASERAHFERDAHSRSEKPARHLRKNAPKQTSEAQADICPDSERPRSRRSVCRKARRPQQACLLESAQPWIRTVMPSEAEGSALSLNCLSRIPQQLACWHSPARQCNFSRPLPGLDQLLPQNPALGSSAAAGEPCWAIFKRRRVFLDQHLIRPQPA